MRKFVLLLLCIALYSLCFWKGDYPSIDLIAMRKVIESYKGLVNSPGDGKLTHREDQGAFAHLLVQAAEAFKSTLNEANDESLQGNEAEAAITEQQSLDLSLPELDEGAFDVLNEPLEKYAENSLPDLFGSNEIEEKPARASFAGRLLMDDNNPNYTMDAVLGLEVSLEFKTH